MNLLSRTVRWRALALLSAVLIIETGCGDVFRPIANPVPTPGGDPQNFDSLVLLNCNGTTGRNGPLATCTGTNSSTALQINISGDSVTNSGDIGAAPGNGTYDQNRSYFYVPSNLSDTVRADFLASTIAPVTIATLPLGSKPIAMFPGSTQMYVLNAGSGAVCPNVGVMNPATLALIQTNCIGTNPSWAIESVNQVFVADSALNEVNVYSIQQQKFIATIPVGTKPVWEGTSFDGNFVYVLNQGSNNISVIDSNALTVVNTISTGGTSPVRGYFDSKLVRLYIINQGSGTVTAFDALGLSTLNLLGTATVGTSPINMTVTNDGTRGFVGNSGTNTVTEFNTGSFTTKTITVGSDPSATVTDIASSRDGTKIYAATITAGNLKNGVTVIRASDETVVLTLQAPRQDATCNPGLTTCPLQQPQQFLGGR